MKKHNHPVPSGDPRAKIESDGSTASYYELPPDAMELQDLISEMNMNAQIGEIFRACYRYGRVKHSPVLRDAKKILFYAQSEVNRLEKHGEINMYNYLDTDYKRVGQYHPPAMTLKELASNEGMAYTTMRYLSKKHGDIMPKVVMKAKNNIKYYGCSELKEWLKRVANEADK